MDIKVYSIFEKWFYYERLRFKKKKKRKVWVNRENLGILFYYKSLKDYNIFR